MISVLVDDLDHALAFYTQSLGFTKKVDLPLGDMRWLTVVSPKEPDGPEILLEPNTHPAAAIYQRALFESGMPLAAFAVDDMASDVRRLKDRGVVFATEPAEVGQSMVAIFDDTCGNLIQIYQTAF